jgi:GT2 family glycosyltransferase
MNETDRATTATRERAGTPTGATGRSPDVSRRPVTEDAASVVAAVTGTVPVVATVTAVIVTRGPNPWFRTTLAAVRAQTRRPTRVVVVDVATAAATGAYADLQLGDARFVAAPRARTFGAGIDAALREEDPAPQWVWLLHDDSSPAPDALAELLRAVEHSSVVALAGVKQRAWSAAPDDTVRDIDSVRRPDAPPAPRLLEVGFTTTRAGRRTQAVDVHEIDQGQYDAREDVLAVGLAGALVRREAWTALGGTDPEVGPFGDGLDLSRRARLAGYRVVVVPSAVVEHARLSLYGVDPASGERPGGDPSYFARRRSELHLRLTGTPAGALPFVALWLAVAAPFHAMYRLAVKQPGRAADELLAPLRALLDVPGVVRARSLARRTARLPRRTLRPLQASWREVAGQRRDHRLSVAEQRRTVLAPSEVERGELLRLASRRRGVLAVVAVGLLALTGVVFAHGLGPLASGGRLVGGALLPATASWSELWRDATTGWVQSGFGAGAPADPLLTALLGPSVLTGGHVQLAVNLLVAGSVLLGGLGAWFAAGALTRWNAARLWAAAVWVAAPSLLLAVDQGRLGALLAHVALPWFALAALRGIGAAVEDRVTPASPHAGRPTHTGHGALPDHGSLGALAASALLLVVVVAGAPGLFVPIALVVAVAAAVSPRRCARLLLVLVVPAVVLAPFWWRVVTTWSQAGQGWHLLLADPGVPVAHATAAPWQLLLGQPAPPVAFFGLHGGWATWLAYALVGSVGLVAVAALLVGRRPAGVRIAWLGVAAGLAGAVLAVHTPVATSVDGVVTGWPGTALSVLVAGLLGAALLAVPERRRLRGWYDSAQRGKAVARFAVVLVAVAIPCGGLASWADASAGSATAPGVGQVALRSDGVVPPVGRQMQQSDAAQRLLALDVAADGGVRYVLLRGDGSQLTDSSVVVEGRALAASESEAVSTSTSASSGSATASAAAPEVQLARLAGLLAGPGAAPSSSDVAGQLAALGVGGVLLPAAATAAPAASGASDAGVAAADARASLVARLDAVPGLSRVTVGQPSVLWRIAGTGGKAAPVAAWASIVVGTPGSPGTAVAVVASSDGRIDTHLTARSSASQLVLAVHAGSGWRATLDGHRLHATSDGWQQRFTVPAGASGHLVVSYSEVHRVVWLVVAGLVLLVVVLLALPVRRRRTVVR